MKRNRSQKVKIERLQDEDPEGTKLLANLLRLKDHKILKQLTGTLNQRNIEIETLQKILEAHK